MKRFGILSVILFFLSPAIFASFSHSAGDSIIKRYDSLSLSQDCPQKDIFNIVFKKIGSKPHHDKQLTALVIPYVGYSPVTQFQLGVGGSLSWYLGDPSDTKLSAATVSANITSERQLIIQAKSNIYANKNNWFLQGDWRFYVFRLSTFGLGTESGYSVPPVPGFIPGNDAEETTSYPMTFDWFKFHQVISKRIISGLYAGLGYHLDYHYMIRDLVLKLDTPDILITPHYSYSVLHDFNPDKYTSSGISINCVFDTRDNILNPYKGFFVNINYRYNFTWLGSTANGSHLWTEFRTYIGLSKKMPRHLIAFWLYGSFHISGEIPFLDLTSSGFDQMNSSGRGYVQGRWRGEDLIYGEVEYRFPISMCSKILGGVVFVNATTASNKDLGIPLFAGVKPAAGFGLRVMLSKRNRINLQLDIGWGVESNGVYIQAQEAF